MQVGFLVYFKSTISASGFFSIFRRLRTPNVFYSTLLQALRNFRLYLFSASANSIESSEFAAFSSARSIFLRILRLDSLRKFSFEYLIRLVSIYVIRLDSITSRSTLRKELFQSFAKSTLHSDPFTTCILYLSTIVRGLSTTIQPGNYLFFGSSQERIFEEARSPFSTLFEPLRS